MFLNTTRQPPEELLEGINHPQNQYGADLRMIHSRTILRVSHIYWWSRICKHFPSQVANPIPSIHFPTSPPSPRLAPDNGSTVTLPAFISYSNDSHFSSRQQ